MSLSWCQPTADPKIDNGLSGYDIYQGTSSDSKLMTKVDHITGTAYTATGLTNGITYYFQVQATYLKGPPITSNQVHALPEDSRVSSPGAPTALTAMAGDAQVSLSWTAPASNGGSPVTGYNIYHGTSPAGESGTPVQATGTSATVTGLTNDTTYYFVVTAVNTAGQSPDSDEASAKPTAGQSGGGSISGLDLSLIIVLGAAVLVAALAAAVSAVRRKGVLSRGQPARRPSVRAERHPGPPGRVAVHPTGSRPTVTVRIEPHPGAASTKIEEMR